MPLDPRFAFLLWLAKRSGKSFKPSVSVPALRAAYVEANQRFGLRDPGGVEAREIEIPANDGATIGARLYRPADAPGQRLPVLLYFHGGGWVIGDLDGYDGFMRYLTHHGRFAVLAVDYRLGPEHRFPRGHEDALDAYAWLHGNAATIGLDAERIAVGGDSAGGGLSAAIANYADARRGVPRPAFAWLIYPSVDATGRYPSSRQYTGNLPLTPESMDWFMDHALNDRAERADPLFVPLDAPQAERHPPTFISAAQYDPLVDEGRAYFERLRNAGVRVAYDLRTTLPHAFGTFAGTIPEAKRAIDAGLAATAAALGTHPAKVVALTGAGSGIGRALAVELAGHGFTLALADRDAAGLEATGQLVRDRVSVSLHVLDVADKSAVDAFAADVLARHARVDVLINNAGVALAGSVAELSVDEIAWLMNINFWGTVYGVKAFLPELERTAGTIVNLSSVFGLVGPPGQAAYAASKFAVRGFSESMREELRGRVHVVTVHPGGIRTAIARSTRVAAAADEAAYRRRAAAYEKHLLTQPPEKAAALIVRGILRKHDRVLIGLDALRIEALARVLGPRAAGVIAKASTPREKRVTETAPVAVRP
jgi:acetyl esterase/lipase/short-subunit dehydrogenase